jgi:hypothetical protein
MANDITVAVTGELLKNGSTILCDKLGNIQTIDTYVKNTPALADIESKYDHRFDDPSYYYGVGNSTVIGG